MSNHLMELPSGTVCVRAEVLGVRRYVFGASRAALSVEDVEALYADAISGDGGREPPESSMSPVYYYSREHLQAALVWIEHSVRTAFVAGQAERAIDGIALVARALAETGT